MYAKSVAQEINEWSKNNGTKIFRDSFGIPFRIIGAEARTKAGNEYVVLLVEHQDGKKVSRPLSAFKYNGYPIQYHNIIDVLNNNTFIEGKSTFDITDKINAWTKQNPYKYFTDKSGVHYAIIGATSPNTVHLISKAGINIDKKINTLIFNGEPLSDTNIYKSLTEGSTIDSQVFYGNIIQCINAWVKQNPDKWFQNGETGRFKIVGAKSQNGITLLTLQNDSGIEKSISLNRLVFDNRKMTIGNAIEFLTLSSKFDNSIRFGDEIEAVNEWLKNEEYSTDGITLDKIPSDTTAHYVNKVMKAYEAYTNLYNKN